MTKVRVYGLDTDNDVVKTEWFNNTVSDGTLELVAKRWKANYGCTRVFAMMDSKNLRDAWFDYVRNCRKRNGVGEFTKIEFIDYLEAGDWELGK